MKNIKDILSNLTQKPMFKKISDKKCFMKVITLLPPHLSRAVIFTYTKNQTLFIVLNHPGFKMEFNYKTQLIKNLIKQVKMIDEDCKNMQEIKYIKYFVSNSVKKDDISQKVLTFKERAKGDFTILTKDRKLQELFLKIKKRIKSYHDNS